MKFKLILIALIAFVCVGCSNLLQTFSSGDLAVQIIQTSGDELQILTQKINDTPGMRNIVETQNPTQSVGYIKILSPILSEKDDCFTLDLKKLSSNSREFILEFELMIDNLFLEVKNGEYDKILVWLGDSCVSLSKNISTKNKEIFEEKQESATLFRFFIEIGNINKIDLSLQTFNIIK